MKDLLADIAARNNFNSMVPARVADQGYSEVGQDDEKVVGSVCGQICCDCRLLKQGSLFDSTLVTISRVNHLLLLLGSVTSTATLLTLA